MTHMFPGQYPQSLNPDLKRMDSLQRQSMIWRILLGSAAWCIYLGWRDLVISTSVAEGSWYCCRDSATCPMWLCKYSQLLH